MDDLTEPYMQHLCVSLCMEMAVSGGYVYKVLELCSNARHFDTLCQVSKPFSEVLSLMDGYELKYLPHGIVQ
jgi:hypothetical protein